MGTDCSLVGGRAGLRPDDVDDRRVHWAAPLCGCSFEDWTGAEVSLPLTL
jgi:hypothetical protein